MRKTILEADRGSTPSDFTGVTSQGVEDLVPHLFERDDIVQVDEDGRPVLLSEDEEAAMNAMPPRHKNA